MTTTMLIQRMSSSGAIGKVQLLICGMSFMLHKNHTNIGILSELYNANGSVGAGPGWCWLQRLHPDDADDIFFCIPLNCFALECRGFGLWREAFVPQDMKLQRKSLYKDR